MTTGDRRNTTLLSERAGRIPSSKPLCSVGFRRIESKLSASVRRNRFAPKTTNSAGNRTGLTTLNSNAESSFAEGGLMVGPPSAPPPPQELLRRTINELDNTLYR